MPGSSRRQVPWVSSVNSVGVGSSSHLSNPVARWCVAAPWLSLVPAGWVMTSSQDSSGTGTR